MGGAAPRTPLGPLPPAGGRRAPRDGRKLNVLGSLLALWGFAAPKAPRAKEPRDHLCDFYQIFSEIGELAGLAALLTPLPEFRRIQRKSPRGFIEFR